MAHIPCDAVEMMFRQASTGGWTKFEDTLRQQRNNLRGIDDNTFNQLYSTAQRMAHSNSPFPKTADELCDQLNQQVHGTSNMP